LRAGRIPASAVTIQLPRPAKSVRKAMRGLPIGKRLEVGSWIVTAIVTLACILFLWQALTPLGR
jgi:hypothetical protein